MEITLFEKMKIEKLIQKIYNVLTVLTSEIKELVIRNEVLEEENTHLIERMVKLENENLWLSRKLEHHERWNTENKENWFRKSGKFQELE